MKETKEQNSKNKKLNTNKGITLIALVITIIVMLILVAVTITMAVNGGLFDYAGKAAGETENAINKEQDLGNGGVTIGDKYYNSIDEYLNEGKPEEIDWEAILADANANPDKYLQQAAEAGQDIEENTAIGIGTNGKVVNMDLWAYATIFAVMDNNDSYGTGFSLSQGFSSEGMWTSTGPGYLGDDFDNIIIPQYIKEDEDFIEVVGLNYTFLNCTQLTEAPKIPETVKYMICAFSGCSDLMKVSELPNDVIMLSAAFMECSSLVKAPVIPENVKHIDSAFYGCTALNGTVKINASNLNYHGIDSNPFADTFYNITNELTIQVPANSTTYETLLEEYGDSEYITIETF